MFVSSGESRLNCPTQPIEVAEGDNVTLQCHPDPLIDVSAYTADWRTNGEVVYSYRHRRHNHDAQTRRYRGRTTFNLDGPSRGDLTLQISSAQLDDSGLYRCFVPKLGISCDVNVSVVPKDQQNRTKRDGDITTSRPPVEDVTKSDHHDAAKTRTYYPTAATIVGFVIVIIGLLVKRGTIKDCWRRLRRRREQEAEMAPKDVQKENLMNRAAEEGEDLDITVKNIQQEV
ncbi:uncharacterized protein [Thunnus thynnus]|uniref:uncharacterized protein isoform X1 n=1 Tax=Thunnus thynnus TaxID=8237 RepID=UPI0035279320